jgi:hypothetical protein
LKLEQDVEAELCWFSDPKIAPERLQTTLMMNPVPASIIPSLTRTATLFDMGTLHGEILMVKPHSDLLFDAQTGRTWYRYSAQSGFGWAALDDLESRVSVGGTSVTISYPQSVRMLSYPVSYDRPDSWVQSHPQKARLEMLRRGHEEHPLHVGPPYVVVHVIEHKGRKPEIHWIEKGICPSWTEDILPDSRLQQLPNP